MRISLSPYLKSLFLGFTLVGGIFIFLFILGMTTAPSAHALTCSWQEDVWVSGYWGQEWHCDWISGYYRDVWVPGYWDQEWHCDWISGYYRDVWVPGYEECYWVSGYEDCYDVCGTEYCEGTPGYEECYWISGYGTQEWVEGYWDCQWVDAWVSGYWTQEWVEGYWDCQWVDVWVPGYWKTETKSETCPAGGSWCSGGVECQRYNYYYTCGTSGCEFNDYYSIDDSCTDLCGANETCSGGVCILTCKSQGETCSAGSECCSGYCVDGVCCDWACTGTCVSCNLTGAVGTCSYVPLGQDPDNECSGSNVCDGNGGCVAATCSEACTDDGYGYFQCSSNNCSATGYPWCDSANDLCYYNCTDKGLTGDCANYCLCMDRESCDCSKDTCNNSGCQAVGVECSCDAVCNQGMDHGEVSCGWFNTCGAMEACCRVGMGTDYCVSITDICWWCETGVAGYAGIVSSFSEVPLDCSPYSGTPQTKYVCAFVFFKFSLSVNPTSGSVAQGNAISFTVTATLTSGTTQSVSFSALGYALSDLPPGVSVSSSPTSCNPTCSSVMTITTSSNTPTGTHTLDITGTAGITTVIANYSLIVTPADTAMPTANISGPSGWQNDEFSVTMRFADNQLGDSGLDTCLYKIENYDRTTGAITTPLGWTSAMNCSSMNDSGNITKTITVGTSTADYCQVEGETACRVYAKVYDKAGKYIQAVKTFKIDWTSPQTEIK